LQEKRTGEKGGNQTEEVLTVAWKIEGNGAFWAHSRQKGVEKRRRGKKTHQGKIEAGKNTRTGYLEGEQEKKRQHNSGRGEINRFVSQKATQYLDPRKRGREEGAKRRVLERTNKRSNKGKYREPETPGN